ncbi:MAG TPA: hypothetical protein VFS77_04730, partial [Pyrinomonadaceae bacterium]|nr:hypothetical protein [Pyrinomonadaceae bacterium]
MKNFLTLTLLLLCVTIAPMATTVAMAQNETSAASGSRNITTKQTKRGPIFRATKEQINQAQALLKSR